jgi:Holliday junction resolvase RusA-like endonuclease
MQVTFEVPGQPVGKGRPIAGRSFAGHTTLRTPTKTVNYEGLVAHAAHVAMAGAPLITGPVSVSIAIACQIPASWSGKKQREAAAGKHYPTTKPDIDNVEKAIFDAINNVVWKDDVQVVNVVKSKRYALAPGVKVLIEEIA